MITGAHGHVTGDHHAAAIKIVLNGKTWQQCGPQSGVDGRNQHRDKVETRAKLHSGAVNTREGEPLGPALNARALMQQRKVIQQLPHLYFLPGVTRQRSAANREQFLFKQSVDPREGRTEILSHDGCIVIAIKKIPYACQRVDIHYDVGIAFIKFT